MDIHHAMIVRTAPDQVYQALTQQADLEVWMNAPALARAEVGSLIEFQYDQGQRVFKLEITRLEADHRVEWRVIQPMWPSVESEQTHHLDADACRDQHPGGFAHAGLAAG